MYVNKLVILLFVVVFVLPAPMAMCSVAMQP